MPLYNPIIVSYPTYGPSGGYTPAATYSFMSSGYKPPSQVRALGADIVVNKNGIFKYLYDNGPGPRTWEPMEFALLDSFASVIGSATTQYQNFQDIWNHTGALSAQMPDGQTYQLHWSDQPVDYRFVNFPRAIGDKIEYYATVQFEEA